MAEELEKNPSSVDGTKDKKDSSNPEDKDGKTDSSNHYYVDGKCFYRDPTSGVEYEWNEDKKEWTPKADDKDYTFDGETYYYTDKTSNVRYRWDKEKSEWESATGQPALVRTSIQKNKKTQGGEEEEEEESEGEEEKKEIVRQDMSKGTYGTDGETLTYTDPSDGTVYFWDKLKNAWFPKVDDDFLAQYQLSYGFVKPEETATEKPSEPSPEKKDEEEPPTEGAQPVKRKAEEPAWFEVSDESNTKVYVSNLPTDITEKEFVDVMQKCGLVMKDPDTGKMKIKLYTDPKTDTLKGDALCTYIKVESVELALKILDGYELRGRRMRVERARFTMKGGAYDPSLKPKKKRRKDKEKIKKMQEKLFDWRPEKAFGEKSKHERVVVIKNLFEPNLFDKEVSLILEYQEDLREECKKCGDVRKVVIYDRHQEGVAQVFFKEFEAAEACVQLLNGRWFGQRKISAAIWDGKTKYKIAETEAEIAERLEKWDKFLEAEEERKEKERLAKEGKGDEAGSSDTVEGKKVLEESKGNIDSKRDPPEDPKVDWDSDRTRSSAGSGDESD